MNYPITDACLANRLRRALEEMPVSTAAACDLRELALFFEFRDNFAKLTAEDQEYLAGMARHMVERDERIRLDRERVKKQCDRPVRKPVPEPDNRTLGERLKGSD